MGPLFPFITSISPRYWLSWNEIDLLSEVIVNTICFFSGEMEKVKFFGIGLLLLYIGFPFVCVGASSLITKCVSTRVQGKNSFRKTKQNQSSFPILIFQYWLGVAQGLRRFGTFIGLILGPLWGGATINQPILQMAVPLTLLLIMTVTNQIINTRID